MAPSQLQQQVYPNVSSFNRSNNTAFLTSQSLAPSNNVDPWNGFLCLGIRCFRKSLDVLKVPILEATTKIPSSHDDDDENVQGVSKTRKEN